MFPDSGDSKESLLELIYSHERTIEGWRERLESMSDSESKDLLVRSQIEFLILNAMSAKYLHETTLRRIQQQEEWMKNAPPPMVFPPAPVAVPLNLSAPPLPNGVTEQDIEFTRAYKSKNNPMWAMIVYVLKNGDIVSPLGMPFTPTDEWTLEVERLGRGI